MGDKEGFMETEQVEENEIKAVLQCPPVYPLPEEIKKMERTETVCLYCGVSYLIFHEFHQLHTQLAQLEAELQELREAAQREKARCQELELGRMEWEKSLHLEVHRQAEIREQNTRKELEERNRDTARALREEFQAKHETNRRDVEEEYQKICEEKERRLRGDLAVLEAEKLRRQREELERRAEEREKVLSDALQKANKNVDELRTNTQQLEERLMTAAATKEEDEQRLGEEKQQREHLRGVCVRQQRSLRDTLSLLRSSSSELTDIRGFLSQLTRAWQAFRSHIQEHSTQVFSALTEELLQSNVDLQKIRDERERLTQQLMEQNRQSEEQLSRQEDSEKEHKGKLLRLKGELEEKHERWLLCQQRCDALQEQLSLWNHREEQLNQRHCAAVEEVTQLRKALEKTQQEMRELRRERDILVNSHRRAINVMKEDYRQQLATKLAAAIEEQKSQSALHLRERMEELRRDQEIELTIEREKNQLLLLQQQRDGAQLQHELEAKDRELQQLQEEVQLERRSREEEDEERMKREEEIRQQQARQLSRAKAELELWTEKNAELQQEVVLLQDTVRRECEEREELTAALSQVQQELFGLRSPASHPGSSRPPPPDPTERHTPQGNKNFYLHSRARVPLTRSSASPNTLRPTPGCTDKDRGRGTDGGGAGRSAESWRIGGDKRREGTLPRLKGSSAVSEVKHEVSLEMGRKERL
ncbi:protein LEKR1 [Mugil cephalus]|uniref:protein LEKR1 n=1 Tax=Mugil cephalus TaxID=48193 RepID=UPI001FB73827|nr:protein LEKR1 [Mugil cephalus]